ncbi:MAG TPA: hypothetical protein DCM40_25305, partial [Maribacter sp.]|nr:hypothetical protein [Maribacter sp.]
IYPVRCLRVFKANFTLIRYGSQLAVIDSSEPAPASYHIEKLVILDSGIEKRTKANKRKLKNIIKTYIKELENVHFINSEDELVVSSTVNSYTDFFKKLFKIMINSLDEDGHDFIFANEILRTFIDNALYESSKQQNNVL